MFLGKTKYRIYFLITTILYITNDFTLQHYNDWIFSRSLWSFCFAFLLGGRLIFQYKVMFRAILGYVANVFFMRALCVLNISQITVYYYTLPVMDLFFDKNSNKYIGIMSLFILIFLVEQFNIHIIIACLCWGFSDFLIAKEEESNILNNIASYNLLNMVFAIGSPFYFGLFTVGIYDLTIQYLLFVCFTSVSFSYIFPVRLFDIIITKYLTSY